MFTLAGLFADVLILRESLTYYRLHDANLFQFSDGNVEAIRRKGRVLAALAEELREELRRRAVDREIADIIVGWVQNEANQELLIADGGIAMEDSPHGTEYLSSDASDRVDGALDLQVRDTAAGLPAPAEGLLLLEAPVRGESAVSEDAREVAALSAAGAHRSVSEAEFLTLADVPFPERSLNILMAAGVPKRREGGVATIIYNLGHELEQRGHRVTYVFLEDLVPPGSASARFNELIFSARLAKYVAAHRDKFSLLNLHAPAGLVYGLKRRWLGRRNAPPYVMTLHGLEERRVEVMTREAKKGRAWNFAWKNRAWHTVYHFPRFRWAIRTADGAHVYSRDVWNMLHLKYGLAPDRLSTFRMESSEDFLGLRGSTRAVRDCDCFMQERGWISAGFFIFATRCCGWRRGFRG